MDRYRVNYRLELGDRTLEPGDEAELSLSPEQKQQLIGNSLTLIPAPKKSTKSPAPAPDADT